MSKENVTLNQSHKVKGMKRTGQQHEFNINAQHMLNAYEMSFSVLSVVTSDTSVTEHASRCSGHHS